MAGTVYAVGVGPGDPELLTQKAVRLIEETGVIAFPGKSAERSAAYRIAEGAVPGIMDKELVPVHMPMTRDLGAMAEAHREGAGILEKYLDEGRDVVWLSLGDPTVFCSFSYLKRILEQDGYRTVLVPGVTSFCAAAAQLGTPLA
ncbi:MAG: precorrin-2 C(20)-methyltransferase, partial [Oscillospiraceae bacterium]|nr:precorrin-2 C(20)-methyltransferase [Oscillospiraceae bacterium]